MQRHYSTVSGTEQKDGLAKVVSLARFREVAQLGAKSGSASGSEGSEMKTAGGAFASNLP